MISSAMLSATPRGIAAWSYLVISVSAAVASSTVGPQPSGPERADTPPAAQFTTANQYNAPITAEALHNDRAKIAIGVHGWTSYPEHWWRDGTNSWNQPGLRSALTTALGDNAAQWDVWGLDWREGAVGGTTSPSTTAEVNAQLQGQHIARAVADGNYTHVHLLGHSLGGRVVETASTLIRQVKPDATIHVTFLDAYTPYTWSNVYGSTATYAEHYYTSVDDISGSLTAARLPHVLNVDMGAHIQARPADYDFYPSDNEPPEGFTPNFLDNESWRHNSPHFFYKATAQNPAAAAYGGFGYGLSRESGRDPWPSAEAKFAPRRNVTLAADGSFTSQNLSAVIEHQANAITRGIVDSAITGRANASVNEAANKVTLSAYSAADNQMGYVNLSLTIAQPVNFFEFDYQWLGLGGGDGRLSFTVHRDGQLFPPQLEFNHLLWASDSAMGFEQRLSTGRLMWTGVNGAGQQNADPLAAGTYDLRFRLDYLQGESISASIGAICAGLLAVPTPGTAVLLTLAAAGAARRRRAA